MGILRTNKHPNITGNKKHYLYAHVLSDSSHPFYIGIGTNNGTNGKFQRARAKRGRGNFWNCYTKNKDYIIVICNESDNYEYIKELEIEIIDCLGRKIHSKDNFLVNIQPGGDGKCGIKWSDEQKKVRSIKYTGEGNPRYGKKGKDNPNSKAVLKLDLSEKVIGEFESKRLAAKSISVSPQALTEAIKNNYKSGGYKWKYKNGN